MIEVADKPISQSGEPAVIAAANVKGVIRSEAVKKLNADRGPTIHQAFIVPNYSYGEPKTLPYNGPQRLVAAPIESEYPAARRPDIEIIKSTWKRALSALSALKIASVAHTIPHEFPERLSRDILKDAMRAWVATLREFDDMEHIIYTEGNAFVSSVIREVLDEGKAAPTEPPAEPEPTPPVAPEVAEQPPAETPTESAPPETVAADEPGQKRPRRQSSK